MATTNTSHLKKLYQEPNKVTVVIIFFCHTLPCSASGPNCHCKGLKLSSCIMICVYGFHKSSCISLDFRWSHSMICPKWLPMQPLSKHLLNTQLFLWPS